MARVAELGGDERAVRRLRRLRRPPVGAERVSQEQRQAMCPDARFHAPPADACGFTFEPYERPSTLGPALIAVRVEDLAVIVDRHATCGYEEDEADAFLRLQRALATARNGGSS